MIRSAVRAGQLEVWRFVSTLQLNRALTAALRRLRQADGYGGCCRCERPKPVYQCQLGTSFGSNRTFYGSNPDILVKPYDIRSKHGYGIFSFHLWFSNSTDRTVRCVPPFGGKL